MTEAVKRLNAAFWRMEHEIEKNFLEPEARRKANQKKHAKDIKALQKSFDEAMDNAQPRLEDDERSVMWNRLVLDHLMFKAEAAFSQALEKGLRKVGKKQWNKFRGPIIKTIQKLANDAASPDGWLAKRLENPSVADADAIKAFIAEAFGLEKDAIPMGWTSMFDELAKAMEELTKGIRGYLPAGPEVAGLLTGPTELEVEPEATEEQPSTAMDAQEALNRAGERFRNRRAAEALAQDTALPETGAEGESDLDGLAGNTALSIGGRTTGPEFNDVRPAEVGRQRRAGAYYPDIGGWLANTAFSIGERRKREYREVIAKKRPDLPAADVDAFMGEMGKLEDTKAEKAALHWFVKGGLQFPEDGEKLGTALKTAAKFKLDPFAFGSPDELLAEADRRNPKKQKLAYIDPDTVPELSNKRDLGHGVVVYDVEDSDAGQAAMRRIMNSHLGRGAGGRWRGPWCLLTATDAGEVSASAKRYWMEYSTSGRGVAFYNGIICAFQSSKIRKTERMVGHVRRKPW